MQSHFTDTIFYQIELTAKYCKLLGQQVFEKFNAGITPEEFSVLDTLSCNPYLCQRDLAKLILKDRANTGKILNVLEEKGYITRFVDMKNNRLVRKMGVTEKGKEVYDDVTEKLKIAINKIMEDEKHKKLIISDEEIEHVRAVLRKFRENLKQLVDIQI